MSGNKVRLKAFVDIAIKWLVFIMAINYMATALVDWVTNPELSQMQIFLRSIKHFLWDFSL